MERRRWASFLAVGVVQGSRESVNVARLGRRRRRGRSSGGGSGVAGAVVVVVVSDVWRWWWRCARRRRAVVAMARHFSLDFSDPGAAGADADADADAVSVFVVNQSINNSNLNARRNEQACIQSINLPSSPGSKKGDTLPNIREGGTSTRVVTHSTTRRKSLLLLLPPRRPLSSVVIEQSPTSSISLRRYASARTTSSCIYEKVVIRFNKLTRNFSFDELGGKRDFTHPFKIIVVVGVVVRLAEL